MLDAVMRMRAALIIAAQRRSTVTYQELSTAIDGLFVRQALGRPLDLLSEDCVRRGEPSLAALVVKNSTGRVGSAFVGDDGSQRELCFRRWSRSNELSD